MHLGVIGDEALARHPPRRVVQWIRIFEGEAKVQLEDVPFYNTLSRGEPMTIRLRLPRESRTAAGAEMHRLATIQHIRSAWKEVVNRRMIAIDAALSPVVTARDRLRRRLYAAELETLDTLLYRRIEIDWCYHTHRPTHIVIHPSGEREYHALVANITSQPLPARSHPPRPHHPHTADLVCLTSTSTTRISPPPHAEPLLSARSKRPLLLVL
ncbi:hypothetical protein PYCC9005_002315 [Savitreella phatthalungensis]